MPNNTTVEGSGTSATNDLIALRMIMFAAEVGCIPSQKRYCAGSQVVNWAQAFVTSERPKALGLPVTSSSRPEASNSFTSGSPPIELNNALFIELWREVGDGVTG